MKHPWRLAVWLVSSLGVPALLACEPRLVVGERACAPAPDAGSNPSGTVVVPWTTSFEDGFCDYLRVGRCYARGEATFSLVTSPAHSGKFSAAFQLQGIDEESPAQARCVHEGQFPAEAYYSAWYFLPVAATNSGNWNLFHFRGGEGDDSHGLWDVSVASEGGELSLYVFDFLGPGLAGLGETPPVPLGAWFQIEVYLRRAADATGAFALYQDGQKIFELTDVRTDDTTWGELYIGNLATALMPPNSTVYVDDVTIRAAE